MNDGWARRRWFDFRQGHGLYLIFFLTFANFVLIFHRLLIERVEFLNGILDQLWIFAIIFVLIYIPIAIIVGAWHRKTQMRVDADAMMRQNPILAQMFGLLIDIQLGKASQGKIDEVREFIHSIETGSVNKKSDK